MIKKAISFILSAVMLIAMAPVLTLPASAANVASGKWSSVTAGEEYYDEKTYEWKWRDGTTVGSGTWTLNDKGVLTVKGKGELAYHYDYDPGIVGSFPWTSSEYAGLIQSAVIGDGITTIGYGVLGYYDDQMFISNRFPNLTNITIPDSVTSISSSAFDRDPGDIARVLYCNRDSYARAFAEERNLPYVLLDGTKEENVVTGYAGRLTWSLDKRTGIMTISGAGVMPPFSTSHPAWEQYYPYIQTVKIGEGITSVSENAFAQYYISADDDYDYYYDGYSYKNIGPGYNNSRIRAVKLPSTIKTIGRRAFLSVDTLCEINFPSGITAIDRQAFGGCTSLPSVTLPDSVTDLGNGVFHGCFSLKSAVLPAGLKEIPNGMFYECSSLTEINIPSGVKRIGASAFFRCGFAKLVLPAALEKIDSYAFSGSKLTALTIPAKVSNIGSYAFHYCGSLKNVVLKNKTNCTVGYCSFEFCGILNKVTFSAAGSTDISERAFRNCEKLTAVAFNKVASIGTEAFAYCGLLKEVILPGTVQKVRNRAFMFCEKLERMEVRNPKMSMYYSSGYVEYEGRSVPDMITPANTVIYGYLGSTADQYASPETFNLMFVELACEKDHEHKFKPDALPACGTDAMVTYTCEYCGNSYQTREIADHREHKYVFIADNASAACGDTGPGRFECVWCGDSYKGKGTVAHDDKITYPKNVTCESFCDVTYTCRRCGEKRTVNEFVDHDWKITRTREYQEGWEEPMNTAVYDCQRCGETHTYRFGDSHRHNGNDWYYYNNTRKVIKEADRCRAEGLVKYTCNECGESGTEIIPADEEMHKWDSGKITKEPTCEEYGERTYSCTYCGKVLSVEPIYPTGHSYGAWEKVDENSHQRVCANDKTHVQTAPHEPATPTDAVPATCTEDGLSDGYNCAYCGAVMKPQTVIKATGHAYGAWEKVDENSHRRVCANDKTHIETAEHTWDGGKVTKEAACTEKGVRIYTCTVCKATKTEEIAAKGHTAVTDKAVAATCTTDGKTEGSHCSVCNAVIKAQETIKATGHKYGAWTKLDDTQHQRVCANDKTHIEKADHAWDAGTVTKEATVGAEGERTFTCTVCGAVKTEPIPKTEPEKPEQAPGDVDGDGRITAADARLALRAAVRLEDIGKGTDAFTAADVDRNGAIEAADARNILRASVGLENLATLGRGVEIDP